MFFIFLCLFAVFIINLFCGKINTKTEKSAVINLKYSVGYQMLSDNSFINEIIRYKDSIKEVYFSWGDFPNGRNSQTQKSTGWESAEKQIHDLKLLNDGGLPFNLLLNGNCYGADSLSRHFFNKIGETIDYIGSNFNLSSVTTTSPIIAKFVKNNFSDISVRASVNMEIGSERGMDYIAEYFDGYYMKREYNRDFAKIKELKKWCEANGKTLHILANSGCLNNCSAHVFHDNLVAHESEIAKMDNCYDFVGVCHEYLKKHEKRISLVRDTNFIRPEDVSLYEPYFDSMKLATRASDKPLLILKSYINKKCSGNILEILEPNHAGRVYPFVIDNSKLNNSYLFCSKNCNSCSMCSENYNNALVDLSEMMNVNE